MDRSEGSRTARTGIRPHDTRGKAMTHHARTGISAAVSIAMLMTMLTGCAALKSTRHSDDSLAPGLGTPSERRPEVTYRSNDGGPMAHSGRNLYYPDVTDVSA